MKWTREQYIELMTFGDAERPMFVELFGPLIGLEEEWKEQGATPEELELVAFDWDYVPLMGCGGNTGQMGGFEPEVLEENEKEIIKRDRLGRTMRLVKGVATIEHPLDYPVSDMESWLELKDFFTFNEDRIDWKQVEKAKKAQGKGVLITASIPGGFDFPRQLLGEEQACLAYYQQPDLMRDIMETVTHTAFKVLEAISAELVIDNLRIHEDMAGKSGPLIGPNIIEEFVAPYYSRIWDLLHDRGTPLFSQDSDGDMTPVVDTFMDCGVNIMYPMEPAAGMDMVEIRREHSDRLAFKGGIDKFVLKGTKREIRAELEYKMQDIMCEGGVVFGLDHRIPNGTPLENYRYYVQTGREILGMPPLKEGDRGWQRMAF